MADDESLTFVLHGENDIVPVDALVDTVKRIAALVLDLQAVQSKGLKPRPWVVASLASSHPTITIKPSMETGANIARILVDGLRVLARGENIDDLPSAFVERPLEDTRALGKILKRRGGLTQIEVSASGDAADIAPLYIDERIHERVQAVLAAGYTDQGSIEGMLEAVHLHGRGSVTLWDDMTGRPVRCPIPKNPFWLEKVRNALGKRVIVSGTIHYFGNGMPRSVDMDELIELSHDARGPTADFGSIPDMTGDEDSVAYVRRMRD